MNGGSRIIEWRQERAAGEGEPLPIGRAPEEPAIDAPPSARFGWVLPLAALILALGWIGAMGWLARGSLPGMPPVALAQFVAALCVPPALLGILLLLGLRTGTAEARRFGRTAQAMRAEAASLERSVGVISRTIDANRIKLAEQTATLTAIGDGAAAGLAAVSAGMTEQVGLADQQARRLAAAADDAQDSLGLLLALLPRAHAETADLARLIETTGLSASEQAAALDAQLVALGERGREAETVAGGAAQRLAAHITRMDATVETAGTRLDTMTGGMSGAVDGLLARTAEAVDGTRRGIAAQGEAMLAMLATNQAALERAGQDGADALAGRMSAIEAVIDRIVGRLDHQRALGEAMVGELDQGIARVSGSLDALHAQGIDRSRALAASIGALGGSAEAMTEALKAGDAAAGSAIETTDRLLVALDSTAREIDETLPAAIARLDAGIAASRRAVAEAKPELISLAGAAEGTHGSIEAIARIVAGQRETLDRINGEMSESLAGGHGKVEALGRIVDDTISRTNRFAEDAAPRLVEALLRVRDTASAAAERARETLATVIPEAAQALESASAAAMRRGAGDAVERQVSALGQAAEAAADAASRASDRLTRQLAAIGESTALVDARVAEARAERENADRDTFSRRVSLLIESLNSASIDIAKSFSSDVSDSAWAAYLKGDRGVFTRRAVRLIDAGEAREIARFYDDDSGFREQVNRYIHDFEAMLRVILAQRDGSPLGVTLLSSDMGKLYVALAQAIERLRN